MARRTLRPRHQEEVKAKIQTSQLVNFLQDHALRGDESKIDATRIRAAEILLARSLPTLSAVEQTTIDVTPAETDLAATIRSVLQSNPELRPMFLALIQDNPDVKPDDHGIH